MPLNRLDCYMCRGTTGVPLSLGSSIYLPPREAVEVRLRFTPPKQQQPDDFTLTGALHIAYTNGSSQVTGPTHWSPALKTGTTYTNGSF